MKQFKTDPGTLLISLDFELMWGMFDKVTSDSYGAQLDGVHTAIPALLELFSEHNIHATWAVVGMLLCHDASEWRGICGQVTHQPEYINHKLSAYQHGNHTDLAKHKHHYFAPELVTAIRTTPGQELASHTWSHFYCLEEQVGGEAVSADSFTADCTTFATVATAHHFTPVSLVFPRNQWSVSALATLASSGYTSYRGTETHFIYQARNERSKTNHFLRGLRLLDRYCNLTGYHTYKLHKPKADTLINLPASRQLTPVSKSLSILEGLRLRRIKNAMTHAAKTGEVFHLWWHPHNFGSNQTANLRFLATILEHFAYLKEEYGMQSLSMSEAATRAAESAAPIASASEDQV